MIFGHVLPFVRRRDKFSGADQWGAAVAHHDLVVAALKYCDEIEAVHMMARQLTDPQAIEELRSEFGTNRVEVREIGQIHELARRHDYIFPLDPIVFLRLSQLRRAGGKHSFPLCAITHTLPTHVVIGAYVDLIAAFEPYDVMVTTSAAGRKSLEVLLEKAADICSGVLGARIRPRINITSIPLGVDTEFLRPQPQAEARAGLGLPVDRPIVLYLGRLSERFKADLEPLLAVFRRLLSENRNALLVIAGKDNEENYAKKLTAIAGHLGIAESCRIIANFPFNQKPLFYSAADVFVSPVDNIQETFGLSILEAMACGVPVVASDWSGYRDLIADGETGYLVPSIWCADAGRKASALAPILSEQHGPEYLLAQRTVIDTGQLFERLRTLLDDPARCRQFGAAGRVRAVSMFGWERVARQFASLWRDQWRELSAFREGPMSTFPCGFNDIFEHFATRVLDEDTVVRHGCLLDGGAMPDTAALRRHSAWMNGEAEEALRVLTECAAGPRSLGSLSGAGRSTSEVVGWLLKKGYLENVSRAGRAERGTN